MALHTLLRRCTAGHGAPAVLARLPPRRFLNLHEDQSKTLLQKYGAAVQPFVSSDSAVGAETGAKLLMSKGATELVLKALVHAGGRGKGHFSSGLKGGVRLTKDPAEVGKLAAQMLGFNIFTKQTPPHGVKVNRVMVAHALDISKETYFAIVMDRESNGPVLVGSPQGGMDIEEVAAKTPNLIFKEPIDIVKGLTEAQINRMASNLGFSGDQHSQAKKQISALYALFLAVDATQVEINPFAVTPQGQVLCFDAKINFDDNAAFRQKEIFALRDPTEEDPREVEADSAGLSYVGMDGNIGCLVNGAGLAMATMDIIKLNGGEPANFLDCGGGVTVDRVAFAVNLITSDPQVKAVLVNIFGGIVDCRTIANGLIKALKSKETKLPLIVRLEGTNVDAAKQLLAASGLPFQAAANLDEAASKAVASIAGALK